MSKTNTTVADINRALMNLGIDAKIHRADYYHHFYGADVEWSHNTSVAVCYTRSMTLASWLDYARDFVHASWRYQAETNNTIPLDKYACNVVVDLPDGPITITSVQHEREGDHAGIFLEVDDCLKITNETLPIVMQAIGPILARWTRLYWPSAKVHTHIESTRRVLLLLDCQ